MELKAVTIPINDLTDSQTRDMLYLMDKYYLNVTPENFVKDLREKDFVILLKDGAAIRGFSTWMLLEHDAEGLSVNVIFSGDTIIDRNYWGSMALPFAWGDLMLSVLSKQPEKRLYWLLTTKGYKTYRFLPRFFLEFYPSCEKEAPPFERSLLCSLGRRKFGDRFDSKSFVVSASPGAQCLREGIADITEKLRKNKHIAFFEKANPGYVTGDELVCIVRCSVENVNPPILKQLLER